MTSVSIIEKIMSADWRANPFLPCMFDRKEDCVDCKLYTTNANTLDWYAKQRAVRYVFHHIAAENPSPDQLIDVLRGYDDPLASFRSEFLETHILISHSPPLPALGARMEAMRQRQVINICSDPDQIPPCPVYRKSLG